MSHLKFFRMYCDTLKQDVTKFAKQVPDRLKVRVPGVLEPRDKYLFDFRGERE